MFIWGCCAGVTWGCCGGRVGCTHLKWGHSLVVCCLYIRIHPQQALQALDVIPLGSHPHLIPPSVSPHPTPLLPPSRPTPASHHTGSTLGAGREEGGWGAAFTALAPVAVWHLMSALASMRAVTHPWCPPATAIHRGERPEWPRPLSSAHGVGGVPSLVVVLTPAPLWIKTSRIAVRPWGFGKGGGWKRLGGIRVAKGARRQRGWR